MARVLIVGAGGHARYVVDAFRSSGEHTVVGAVAPDCAIGDEVCAGVVVSGQLPADVPALVDRLGVDGFHVGIGDNDVRRRVAAEVRAAMPSLVAVAAVHATAVLGERASVGVGSVVAAGVVVHTDAIVGAHCYLGANATLEHDSSLGDFSSLAPGVVTGGGVEIGSGTAVAIGAVIKHGVRIGDHTVIGAGALVLDDVEGGVVAYGTPARVVRTRSPGDRYL